MSAVENGAFRSRVVVVTGAGSGIGRVTARAFAREGATIVVASRTHEHGAETARDIEREGLGRALPVQTDVSSEPSVQALFETVADRFGRLDVLVNNAGVSFGKPFHEIETPEWDRVMDTNLKGVFLCSRYAVQPMRLAGGGSMVNVSSVDALRSLPGIAPYAAAKGAVNSLTQAMALDLARFNIRVNAVLPGFVGGTAIWERWMTSLSEAERRKAMSEVLGALAIKRVGTPEDVAAAVLFLAGSGAGYITGTTLIVDGGLTARAYVVTSDEA